jgi:hypothetical protein
MKTARILVMCVLAVILFATAAGCNGSVSRDVPATTPSLAMSESSPGPTTPSVVFDAYVRNIQAGIEPIPSIPAVSPSEAKTKTGISVRLPKNTELSGKLKGIYPDTSASENPELCLGFTNGILINEEIWKEKPDYAAEIAAEADDRIRATGSTQGFDWTLVQVAGFQGKLLPETALEGADQEGYKLPPHLEWWENGIRYHMSAWKLGYSGQQLLDIANSMY